MSAAESIDHQGSWGSILLISGTAMWVLLWLVIHRFSSAGAHDSVRPRISVAH